MKPSRLTVLFFAAMLITGIWLAVLCSLAIKVFGSTLKWIYTTPEGNLCFNFMFLLLVIALALSLSQQRH